MQLQQEFLVVSKDDTQMIIKGKRTKRQRAPSPLSLVMPNSTSSSTNNSNSIDSTTTTTTTIELRQDEDMANCLILLAQGRHHVTASASRHDDNNNNDNNDDNNKSTRLYLYQCKTCNRCFPSFQALGGHRASHKKPRQNGTFSEAVTTFENNIEENINDRYNDPTTSTTLSLKIPNTSTGTVSTTKAKAHECSICGAEFSSGQALGGHMRRHRSLVHASMTTSMSSGNVVAGGSGSHEYQEAKKPFKLDLNLPAPDDDHRESKFSFQQREKVIVFSKSSLVDCHY